MTSPARILGLSGSLRDASTNTALLRYLGTCLPDGVVLDIYDYGKVPLFNGDLEPPAAVEALKAAIGAADGVLIATPEYNYSVPGVLKNAIDWASRPAYRSVFMGKPTGVVSASASFVGGARAQQHLKTILLGMGTPVYAAPELLVGAGHTKVTAGVLTDEPTQGYARAFAVGFAAWVTGAHESANRS